MNYANKNKNSMINYNSKS